MPRHYSISLDLPNYGKVTAEVDYYMGYPGSYWEPADPDEILVKKIINQNGEEISLTDEKYEEYYDLFLEASFEVHNSHMNSYYGKYAESLADDSSPSDVLF
jgi:hypothetical protein